MGIKAGFSLNLQEQIEYGFSRFSQDQLSDIMYIAPLKHISYNKIMNNTLKVTPDMSVQSISQLPLELGCEVIIGQDPRIYSLLFFLFDKVCVMSLQHGK